MTAKTKFDVYGEVTNAILDELKKGTAPWRQPWNHTLRMTPKKWNNEDYKGINILLLWITAANQGFTSPRWMTFNQAKTLGGNVRKGQKSAMSIKYGVFERTNKDDNSVETIPFAKSYRVFNANQIDDLPDEFYDIQTYAQHEGNNARIDHWLNTRQAQFHIHKKSEAYYHPKTDIIHIPNSALFKVPEQYYTRVFHELVHWTGHSSRLARLDETGQVLTKAGDALEELIAELGACMMAARLGIQPEFDQSAAYMQSWIDELNGDKRAIFRAAAAAQAAVDMVKTEDAFPLIQENQAA